MIDPVAYPTEPDGDRSSWLAELDQALESADRVIATLRQDLGWQADAASLSSSIEAVRLAVEPLRHRSLASVDPEWTDIARWLGGLGLAL